MGIRNKLIWIATVVALLPTACGEIGQDDDLDSPSAPNPDCVPDDVEGAPLLDPDRRIEDIIEVMTGERQTSDLDPVEETIDDPNFGGVWGDLGAGVVVAVLDCSQVDANELARIAGGREYLHLIEVPATFHQVNEYRDALAAELRDAGLEAEIWINSTLTGRFIEVRVLDAGQLPGGFGEDVPGELWSVTEVPALDFEV